MRIDVRTHGLRITADERAFTVRRFESELAHAEGWVKTVLVFLSDENGPKGGVDKTCRVAVTLKSGPPVVIEHRAGDVTAAADGAAHRTGSVVLHQIDREREHRRVKLHAAVDRVMTHFGRRRVTAFG